MSRDFWLAGLQSFNDGADANFIRSEQVNYAQAGSVGESFEELLNTEISVSHYVLNYQGGCSFVRFQEGCGSSTGKSSRKFSQLGERLKSLLYTCNGTAAFHDDRVAPNAVMLSDALSISHLPKAARSMQSNARDVLGKDAVL